MKCLFSRLVFYCMLGLVSNATAEEKQTTAELPVALRNLGVTSDDVIDEKEAHAVRGASYREAGYLEPPESYQFTDENGNIVSGYKGIYHDGHDRYKFDRRAIYDSNGQYLREEVTGEYVPVAEEPVGGPPVSSGGPAASPMSPMPPISNTEEPRGWREAGYGAPPVSYSHLDPETGNRISGYSGIYHDGTGWYSFSRWGTYDNMGQYMSENAFGYYVNGPTDPSVDLTRSPTPDFY